MKKIFLAAGLLTAMGCASIDKNREPNQVTGGVTRAENLSVSTANEKSKEIAEATMKYQRATEYFGKDKKEVDKNDRFLCHSNYNDIYFRKAMFGYLKDKQSLSKDEASDMSQNIVDVITSKKLVVFTEPNGIKHTTSRCYTVEEFANYLSQIDEIRNRVISVIVGYTPLKKEQLMTPTALKKKIANNYVAKDFFGNLNNDLVKDFGSCAYGALDSAWDMNIQKLSNAIFSQCN